MPLTITPAQVVGSVYESYTEVQRLTPAMALRRDQLPLVRAMAELRRGTRFLIERILTSRRAVMPITIEEEDILVIYGLDRPSLSSTCPL